MPPIQFEIRNALTRVNDPVDFAVSATRRTGLKLVIISDALSDNPGRPRRIPLAWQKSTNTWTGIAQYTPDSTGHYHAILMSGSQSIAGRYFAAITGNEAVATLWLNGLLPGKDDYGDVVRPHYLPMDHHIDIHVDDPPLEFLADMREAEFRYGQTPVPRLTAERLGYHDRFSLWEFTLAETIAGIEKLKTIYRENGLCPINNLNTHWCMGNVTMQAIRKSGINIMSGMVANYEMRDGESREICNGTPLRPYWVHRNDFRKAGRAGGRSPLICIPFSVTIPTDFYRGNPDTHWAPDIAMVWDRSIESSGEGRRSMEVLDMLCDHNRTASPYVIPIAIQNFGPPAVYENNRNALRYAITKAQAGELFFANSLALFDYMTRYERETPETIGYIRDFMVGSHLINKPICHPDVMQIENCRCHAAWEAGNPLPEYLFDYTRKWDYPDSDFLDYTRHGPEPESLRNVKVSINRTTTDTGLSVDIQIKSNKAMAQLPVALWHVPVKIDRAVSKTRGLRIRTVRTPLLRTPHLIVIGPISKGQTTWTVTITGPPAVAAADEADYHGIVGFKTMPNPGGIPYTYIYADLRINMPIRLSVPTDRRVWAETYDCGSFGVTEDGELSLELKWPRPFARIWNVDADDITVANGTELDTLCRDHLISITREFPIPDRRKPVDRLLNKLARNPEAHADVAPFVIAHQNAYIDKYHDRMVRGVRKWFRSMTSEIRNAKSKILLEAHAYARGHIGGPWRDQADLANVVKLAKGVDFDIPVYDYAVCEKPGHRSWQMGRAFMLRFFGLASHAHKSVTVYLHAYDYDCLGRSYSVRVSHPDVFDGNHVVLMETTWPLPQGSVGRDDPGSLFPIQIPETFLTQPFFNMHVFEHYDQKNIDFRKQVPYSVAISDVWVTAE